jgi:hypothetical protein
MPAVVDEAEPMVRAFALRRANASQRRSCPIEGTGRITTRPIARMARIGWTGFTRRI